ncbi:MAG: asparaginase [Lachnospiraceae bacterium]|nr:asparaginase [Ruminococcus sp.]MCM1275401.1 asparaginase [Lachnospiraceae bacterium]
MRKILILGTGGTIACAETENGLAPSVGINELLKGLELSADICCEQLFELDSTNMTPRHWEKLAERIRERYDEFDGFVILHGTDTMAYAAASLSCLIQNSRKPIVFTGSMLPMNAEESDAPRNLRDAVRFAANERAFGVRVVFNGVIIDGRRAKKTSSAGALAFDYDACGFIADEIKFHEEFAGETRFYERLSDDVYLAKLIPGQGLCVPEGTKALIPESYGTGGVPDYLLGRVTELANAGVYVIIATQCAYGGTNLNEYEVGRYAAKVCPLLETGKMTVEYAVARARWALAYSEGYDEFKRLFNAE